MNNSKIEQDDIERKIKISRRNLEVLEIQYKMVVTEESYINIKTQIEREKKNLQALKDKYPEHFI